MTSQEAAETRLREMLGSEVRVTLSDGRIVNGAFECIDQGMNAIVRDKKIGLVMVPGIHVAKFEVEAKDQGSKATAEAAPAETPAPAPVQQEE
ncbi:N-alpha-acetyltransferase 38, NatC auxiliary subunit [Hondaea fermentalgiana]|uniref:N-alpha-acetyltransferase 38, NatC auxiliary subunit n=1 Tax=Hondaea fermentalgiana TaxID=2315210 RepID=A0A2R5GVZ9_9STRA|nr:N-alpha-acetyltransferase 38, NatC auxiliary subunit [Hondaea fermentalgiana]|eukprot:GBG32104.1 N-alpha-acetyltransferase 38, NatC auxiliary subunit [Hondaea fermentalgiana]